MCGWTKSTYESVREMGYGILRFLLKYAVAFIKKASQRKLFP